MTEQEAQELAEITRAREEEHQRVLRQIHKQLDECRWNRPKGPKSALDEWVENAMRDYNPLDNFRIP